MAAQIDTDDTRDNEAEAVRDNATERGRDAKPETLETALVRRETLREVSQSNEDSKDEARDGTSEEARDVTASPALLRRLKGVLSALHGCSPSTAEMKRKAGARGS
jgi:hypothetical protein